VFDLRVPESLVSLPGRRVAVDMDQLAKADRIAKDNPPPHIAERRRRERELYALNKDRINARRRAGRIPQPRGPKQTDAERAEAKRLWWIENRDRINEARRAARAARKF